MIEGHRSNFLEYESKSCWTEIINDLGPNTITGCCYYKHPKKPFNNKSLEQLKITLTKIKNKNKYVIVCGDFDLLNHQNDERVGAFLYIMYSHFLQPFINEPTRMIAGQRPSIVDIFTDIFEKNLNSSILIDKRTDHLLNF